MLSGYFFGDGKMKRLSKILSVMLSAAVLIFAFCALPQADASAATAEGLSAGRIAVSRGGLNVRSAPNTSSSVKKVLMKGDYVTLVSLKDGWWYVKYSAEGYGYCSAAYIDELEESYEAYVATSSGRLNVRKGPSTAYSVRTTLAKASRVVVLGKEGSFYKILYNGRYVGYAAANYIKRVESDGIQLSVPKYYQTDSRWKNTKLGSSGKTIGDIGCTVTCLAMSESYRTGTTVTPDVMASKLRFTSGGALYWPAEYNLYTGSDYLAKIAEVLESGRPVIYGGRTATGGSHWVIIKGYNGNGLSPENFTVNDPASSKITTLDKHISRYPNFIRIAYYK